MGPSAALQSALQNFHSQLKTIGSIVYAVLGISARAVITASTSKTFCLDFGFWNFEVMVLSLENLCMKS